jgi:O-antigen/teichoic acid export membrane protein
MVVLPRFALAHNQGPAELRAELGLRLRHFAPAILPLAVGGAILAQPILVALFGPQFADGAAPFALLLLSVPLSSFGSLILYSLVAARRHWALPIGSACGAFVNVALNLLLIPRFGMMGAAWATIAAVSVVLAVAVMQARSFLPRFAWPAIVRLGIALTMLGVVVAATATRWLPLAVVLGGVAYLVALRAVAYWRAEELAAARLYLARMLQRGRSRDRP